MNQGVTSAFTEAMSDVILSIDDTITEIILEKYNSALLRFLKQKSDAGDDAKLVLPHMTLEVKERSGGEGGNINIAAKFSKTFLESLNDDKVVVNADDVPEEFLEMYYGILYDEGTKMAVDMNITKWLVAFISRTISDIARKHAREGKDFEVDLDHGTYTFTMKDGEIEAQFSAAKMAKQSIKNDSQLK